MTGVIVETLWLSISPGNGPEECAHVAALTLRLLIKDIEDKAAETVKEEA
jgi:protein subunit release factor B